jgi:AcrR family transcriptional regulator
VTALRLVADAVILPSLQYYSFGIIDSEAEDDVPTTLEGRQAKRKQRTRTAVQGAALALFAERGYSATTMSAIADAADVALRTVTVHFPTKADLLFTDEPFTLESLETRLDARQDGESALEALRDWMRQTMQEIGTEAPEAQHRVWQRRAIRAQVISADEELRARARAAYYPYEQLLAHHIARDLSQPADSLIPRLAAITAVTGLRELYQTREARTDGATDTTADLLPVVDQVLVFARAGIAGTPS